MMRRQSIEDRNQFAILTIDDLVSKDHLVRKIDAAIQFDFIYPIVESTYSTYGCSNIDPVVFMKELPRCICYHVFKSEIFHLH